MCFFCDDEIKKRIIYENNSVFAIADRYPVTNEHLLVITKRHAYDWLLMTDAERYDANKAIIALCNKIKNNDSTVTGFNIGMNCGISAGQTVMHAHIHLIPRREGDIDDPRGGVRGCIPGKMRY